MRTAIIRRHNEQLAIVNRTLRATGSSLELATVLEEATRGALELTGCDYGMLCVRDPQRGDLRVGARVHARSEAGRPIDAGPMSGAECPAMMERRRSEGTAAVVPAGTDPRCGNVNDPLVRWNAWFPLEAQGLTALSLLYLFSRKVLPPSLRDVDLVSSASPSHSRWRTHACTMRRAIMHRLFEHRVEARTDELAVAKLAAEAADRLKSAFLATMSHELRTPLNSIIGFTGILLQGLAGPPTRSRTSSSAWCRAARATCSALINDVLDISKIEAGPARGRAPTRSTCAGRSNARASRPRAAAGGEEEACVFEGAPSPTGDPREWSATGAASSRSSLNLLNNAIKFTETVRCTLTVDGRETSGGEGPACRPCACASPTPASASSRRT